MKRMCLSIILIMFCSFYYNVKNVFADDSKLICEYRGSTVSPCSQETYYHSASIYYYPDNNQWEITWDFSRDYFAPVEAIVFGQCAHMSASYSTTRADSAYVFLGTASGIGGYNAYFSQETYDSFQNGTCPANAYIDDSSYNVVGFAAIGADSICFDNDNSWCKSNLQGNYSDNIKLKNIVDYFANSKNNGYLKRVDESKIIYNTIIDTFDKYNEKMTNLLNDNIFEVVPDYCLEEPTYGYFDDDDLSMNNIYLEFNGYFNNFSYGITIDQLKEIYKDTGSIQNYFNNAKPILAEIQDSEFWNTQAEGVLEKYSTATEKCTEIMDSLVSRELESEEEAQEMIERYEKELAKLNSYLDFYKKNGSYGVGNVFLDFYNANSCTGLLGTATVALLDQTFDLIKYIAIILLLVLSIIDFVKAIPSQDKDLIKKAAMSTVKRLIIAIIIYFLPLLLEFILNLFGIEDALCNIR